ncbi:phage holin family protein [Microbacterium sp. STN6]|uniref:phage holin family protein n=1 Tax=Microbacterium sp. STN6 TaxID=2995588 RepID=UPI0022609319|nr:phage holin family protein [Microbacterium sp. STN6]MCX7522657.1 phage holin family protein [Microbacterium sp. STN6]
MTDDVKVKSSRSLLTLIKDLPTQLIALVKAELAQLKAEMVSKAIHAGVGIGLFAFAGLLAFFLLALLITAGVLALALVFPGWLAALLGAAGLAIIIIVLVLVGIRWFKKGMPPLPTKTIGSVKEDVNAIRGMGKYDH